MVLVIYVHTAHAIVVNFDHFWFHHGVIWHNMLPFSIHVLLNCLDFMIWSSVRRKQSDKSCPSTSWLQDFDTDDF